MRGRGYHVLIEMVYLGGTLSADEQAALLGVLRAGVPRLSLTVTARTYDVVTIDATVRSDTPLDALTIVSAALNRALLHAGLFETFDVTGRVLRVAPAVS